MAQECDFAFYQEIYGGSLSQAEFTHFLRRAGMFLSFATRGKSDRRFGEEKIKLALCAVADELAQGKRSDKIRSEKAGQYSVTYREDAEKTDLYRAAAVYLDDGMLFRGWGGC